jgi:putative ABC transport system substrate-binding protein
VFSALWFWSCFLRLCESAEAQQPKKIPRIGVFASGSPSSHKYIIGAIQQGLYENGYVEGQNIAIEYRYGEGKADRFPDLAAELVSLKLDVIIVGGTAVGRAVKAATSTIPVVVGSGGDLIGSWLVASLAKPGGNITGSTSIAPDLSGTRQ